LVDYFYLFDLLALADGVDDITEIQLGDLGDAVFAIVGD